jgi:hypothetical protein
MKTIGLSKTQCIINLRLFRDKMEKILSLVEDKLPLRSADQEKVQLLLGDLKQALKTDLNRYLTGKGRYQMSSVEKKIYFPAIHEAERRISVEINSIPSQTWIDEIDIAQKYIKYYLNQLQS